MTGFPIGRQRGLTLIELMVALLLGLMTTVVIMQVLVAGEGRRRGTTSGSETQTRGALSLYAIQRDVMSAGYGLNSQIDALGCTIKASKDKGNTTANYTLAPIVITDGANGAPDALRTLRSAKSTFALPTRISQDHPPQAANFFVDTTLGIDDGDIMVAVPETWDANNWCSLFQVTQTAGSGGTGNSNGNGVTNAGNGNSHINHSSGLSDWNQPGGQTIFPTDGYKAGSFLVNLGAMVLREYRIDAAANLELDAYSSVTKTSTVEDLYPDVVNLQAYYGRDTNADSVVDTYDNVAPVTPADWKRIKAVRIAMVVRGLERDKQPITQSVPEWDVGTVATPAGAAPCVSGSGQCIKLNIFGPNPSTGQTEWQHYRYKVYDTVIPLRNLLWNS